MVLRENRKKLSKNVETGHSQKCFAFHARDGRFVETPVRKYQPPHTSKLERRLRLADVPISTKGQDTKGAGRMPWHQEPKKDAISCEKPRGGANIH